jgi:S-formylglutathione hydrolase FrmB
VRALAGRLKELGRKVSYEEIPGGDHDSPIMDIDWGEALGWVALAGGKNATENR